MTPTEFRHAADRGMGRAALCLIENDPAPYLPDLLETCVRGHDQDGRVDYLFALIAFARAEVWAEDQLLARLPVLEYEHQAKQLWGVLNRLAMLGFPRSREAVMAYAFRTEHGAKLVAGWGVEGLRWLSEARPQAFEGGAPDFIREMVDAVERVSGEEAVEASLSPAVYFAGHSSPCFLEWPKVDGLSWEDFLARMPSFDPRMRWNWANDFAKVASPEDWVRAAEWTLTDEARTMNWLVGGLFGERPWPLDPTLLFPRLDEDYPWRSVLSRVNHPQIRDFAFERLERPSPDWSYASVMASSIGEGNFDRLMRILSGIQDPADWGIHDLYIGLADMAKRAKRGLLPAFEWGMENTWCSICRKDIATGLARKGLLPNGFRAEAGYDVESEVRRYADDRRASVLSASRFRRAATKGQGRAVLSAMNGPASLYASEVRWVALFGSPMLDEEIESRAAYVWRLIELVGVEEKVLDDLLLALQAGSDDEYTRGWHRAIVGEYAKRGSVRAQAALPPSEEVSEKRRRPKGVATATAEELARRFDAEPDFGLRRREAWAFGRKASESEFRLWAERMLREDDEDTLDAMGGAFFRRPWPLEPQRVIERVKDENRDRCVWRRILKAMPNPEVRAFALVKLAEKEPDSDAIGYLRNAFQPGDEATVYAALGRVEVEEDEETKYFAWEVVNLAHLHGAELFLPHLEWVVEHSSSSLYRRTAVEQLLKTGALSDYHRKEAQYDAEPETRALVDQA